MTAIGAVAAALLTAVSAMLAVNLTEAVGWQLAEEFDEECRGSRVA